MSDSSFTSGVREFFSPSPESSSPNSGMDLSPRDNFSLRERGRPAKRQRILILDSDDTLYRNDGIVAAALTSNIQNYCHEHCGLREGEAYKLYRKHGTTIKGLLVEGYLKESKIDEFLDQVHTFENLSEMIQPDLKLRKTLLNLRTERFIFTAGPACHGIRCWKELGVDDLLLDGRPIIDAKACKLITKYKPGSYQICRGMIESYLGRRVDPANFVFVDDNYKNLKCAKSCGWGTCILIGKKGRDGQTRTPDDVADFVIEHLSELEKVTPDLFC